MTLKISCSKNNLSYFGRFIIVRFDLVRSRIVPEVKFKMDVNY